MLTRALWPLAALAVLLTGMTVLLAAPAAKPAQPKVPPFQISSDDLRAKLGSDLVYTGHVVFTSPVNKTKITCDRLEGNAISQQTMTSVKATGNVVITMLVPAKGPDKPAYQVDGRAPVMTYAMTADNPLIRLLKEKDVNPVLTITDMTTKQPMIMKGEMIEYNLKTNDLHVTRVDMEHKESAP